MGFFDKLFGRDEPAPQPPGQGAGRWDTRPGTPGISYTDEQALARYRYMLKTAPPEALEEAHAEAFARLTPEQRQLLLQQLADNAPAGEAPRDDDPRTLARAATRAEMRQPGMLERTMGGGMGGGMMGGMGGAIGGTLLASVAGTLIGSAVAHSFFSNPAVASDYNGTPEAQSAGDAADPAAEATAGGFDSDGNADPYGDPGLQEGGVDSDGNADPYGDPGADAGYDSGGDFGGGDFGGGDFGGDF